MTGILAGLLLALAGFTAAVVHRSAGRAGPRLDTDQLRGFCYVGAAALVLVAVVVVIVGVVRPGTGMAEGTALLGFFGYVVYLGVTAVVLGWTARRARRGR